MLDDIIPLEPIHFFEIQIDIGKEPTLLPDFLETGLAKVYLYWSFSGVHFNIDLNRKFDEPHFPNGDCIEFFIDTRDVKSSSLTRFCHHFVCFPEMVDQVIAQEITRFRTEEKHALALPELLQVQARVEKGKRKMEIFIPKEALYGYDPSAFNKMGFTYKITGRDGKTQLLSASSEDFVIESHPCFWASLRLKEKV